MIKFNNYKIIYYFFFIFLSKLFEKSFFKILFKIKIPPPPSKNYLSKLLKLLKNYLKIT